MSLGNILHHHVTTNVEFHWLVQIWLGNRTSLQAIAEVKGTQSERFRQFLVRKRYFPRPLSVKLIREETTITLECEIKMVKSEAPQEKNIQVVVRCR